MEVQQKVSESFRYDSTMSDGEISEDYDDDFAYQGFARMNDEISHKNEAIKVLEEEEDQKEDEEQNEMQLQKLQQEMQNLQRVKDIGLETSAQLELRWEDGSFQVYIELQTTNENETPWLNDFS